MRRSSLVLLVAFALICSCCRQVLIAVQAWSLLSFAMPPAQSRSAAPYGRIGGRPIVPNPEAEKFPAGVPRDEDGFPVITLREQYEVNVSMYEEGLGPHPGPPPDFSGDWDYIPPDPEDEDYDPDVPLGKPPPDPPSELLDVQPVGLIAWPQVTEAADDG
mmetsp:Transcript_45528/g.105527  ORF Transcript_45528/g.105527 Transcript_45528/m.105527 type:complete len:160 (+) Transcript_45528:74-553(+)